MDNTIFWYDQRNQVLNSIPAGLVQHFVWKDTILSLYCDLVEYSFSVHPKTVRVCHPKPLFTRLTLVETGTVHLETCGKTILLQAGDMYYLPSGLPFLAEYCKGSVTKGFHLHVYDELKFNDSEYRKEMGVLKKDALFPVIMEAVREQDCVQIDNAVFSAVAKFMKPGFPAMYERMRVPPLYREIIQEMDRLPLGSLHLSQLTHKFHITPDALSKGFHRTFGISWTDYRNQRILLEARRHLAARELNIAEIASALGFENVNYFFIFFKHHSGMTPLQFRKRINQKT